VDEVGEVGDDEFFEQLMLIARVSETMKADHRWRDFIFMAISEKERYGCDVSRAGRSRTLRTASRKQRNDSISEA
jgi:hypothetical protein